MHTLLEIAWQTYKIGTASLSRRRKEHTLVNFIEADPELTSDLSELLPTRVEQYLKYGLKNKIKLILPLCRLDIYWWQKLEQRLSFSTIR